MRVMTLFSTSFFAKCLHVDEDGPGWGHPCHIDTFLVLKYNKIKFKMLSVATLLSALKGKAMLVKN